MIYRIFQESRCLNYLSVKILKIFSTNIPKHREDVRKGNPVLIARILGQIICF